MTGKPIHVLPQAENDLRQATAWYREQSGEALAVKWVDAVSAAIRHVAAHPRAGASRYAVALNLGGLPFWRVLHAQRDIPEWMGELQ